MINIVWLFQRKHKMRLITVSINDPPDMLETKLTSVVDSFGWSYTQRHPPIRSHMISDSH